MGRDNQVGMKSKPLQNKMRRRSFDDDPIAEEQEAGNMMVLLQKMLTASNKSNIKDEIKTSKSNKGVEHPRSPPSIA